MQVQFRVACLGLGGFYLYFIPSYGQARVSPQSGWTVKLWLRQVLWQFPLLFWNHDTHSGRRSLDTGYGCTVGWTLSSISWSTSQGGLWLATYQDVLSVPVCLKEESRNVMAIANLPVLRFRFFHHWLWTVRHLCHSRMLLWSLLDWTLRPTHGSLVCHGLRCVI